MVMQLVGRGPACVIRLKLAAEAILAEHILTQRDGFKELETPKKEMRAGKVIDIRASNFCE
jgi:hypothetical protein